MRYLDRGPAKLKYDGKERVVEELGPDRGVLTPETRLEDEGEADESTDCAQQVPTLLLPVLQDRRNNMLTTRLITRSQCLTLRQNQRDVGVSETKPTIVVETPSAIWPTRRITPAALLSRYRTWR